MLRSVVGRPRELSSLLSACDIGAPARVGFIFAAMELDDEASLPTPLSGTP
jgi:hypothetical protein